MPRVQAEIIVYCTRFCPYCVRARSLLDSKGVSYTSIDIHEQPDKYPEMVERSGGVTSVPQIFIGNHHIGGCDDLFALESQAKLDKYLFP